MTANVDEEFRKLHEETVRSYEHELERRRESHERLAQSERARSEQMREIMRASQIDFDRLDQLEEAEKTELQNFRDEVRPALANRPPLDEADARKLKFYSGIEIPKWDTVSVYAATLLSSDQADVDEIPGEKGNPWVLPLDPSKIHTRAFSAGVDSGCDRQPLGTEQSKSVVFYFPFVPNKDGMWYLLALINLHGFYIMRANRTRWNCKYASAGVSASVDVVQYWPNWIGARTYNLLNIGGTNIAFYDLWDGYGQFDYMAPLRANDPVWVKVTIFIGAYAQGTGSSSELNFRDGTANYIQPVLVAARPS